MKSFIACLSIGLTFAVCSIAQCAHAAPVDNLYNTLIERGETLAQDEAQYKFCNWLAETNRHDAMRRGLEDEAVQLSYEDTFDYCYELPFSALGLRGESLNESIAIDGEVWLPVCKFEGGCK